jgi:hypothetical protein
LGLDSGEQIAAEKIFPNAYEGGPLYDVRGVILDSWGGLSRAVRDLIGGSGPLSRKIW